MQPINLVLWSAGNVLLPNGQRLLGRRWTLTNFLAIITPKAQRSAYWHCTQWIYILVKVGCMGAATDFGMGIGMRDWSLSLGARSMTKNIRPPIMTSYLTIILVHSQLSACKQHILRNYLCSEKTPPPFHCSWQAQMRRLISSTHTQSLLHLVPLVD